MLSLWTATLGAPWHECSTTGTPWGRRAWGNGRGPRWPGPSHLVHFSAATARKHHLSTGKENDLFEFQFECESLQMLFLDITLPGWFGLGCICRSYKLLLNRSFYEKSSLASFIGEKCVFQWWHPTSTFPWWCGRRFSPRYERPHARLWRCFKNFITHRNT